MRSGTDPRPRIACLLGKPPRPATVITEVLDRLRVQSATVSIHLPNGDGPLPSWLFDAHLVIQRGLGLTELTSALPLEQAGIRCCNRIAATIALIDRAATVRTLAESGVPVPATTPAFTWEDVLDSAGRRPVVVKANDGSIGRGLGVLVAASGILPQCAPFAGPYVVQEFIRGDGQDYKLYVAGRRAEGLLKRGTPHVSGERIVVPYAVDANLIALSEQVGAALGIEIFGFDVLMGSDGPVVVDVNPFPGFRDVSGAAAMIAAYLTTLAKSASAG